VKAGINSASANAVPAYYDFLLCCHPLFPDAIVDASAGTGFAGGGFASLRIHPQFAVQGELLFSRKRHGVDLQPYEAIEIAFGRDYVEVVGLARLEFPLARQNHIYAAAGPVFGFRIGERADSSDRRLTRGNPDTEIYAVQALVYAAPELLRITQASIAAMAGWGYRRLIVEVRLTQGLQSLFKDRDKIVSAFVSLGGHEPTLRRLITEFGPILESARNRDVAVLTGFRF